MAVTKNISLDYQDVIVIGRRGENEAVDIVWDISPLVAEFGGGTALVLAKRATDESAYPVTLTEQTDTTLTWTVSSVDSCVIGVGKVQLFWYVGNVLAKSFMWRTFTGDDITGMVGDPPEAYESWIEHLAEMGADILNDAKDEVKNAEAWAVGERGGEPVVDGDETYHNNAKYWAGVSSDYAGNAESSADAAEQSAGDAAHQVDLAADQVTLAEAQVALAEQKVQDAAAQVALAEAQANAAAGSASDASGYALAASGYASDANTYKGQANTSAQNAAQSASDAAGYALAASGSASDANTYKGQAQGFANAASGYADNASTYANNASGYADAASASADAAAASATEAASYVASLVNGKAGVLEDSASGDVVTIVPDKSVGKLYKAEVSLSPIQSGSGDPSPANVRPISGHTGATLNRTGKNLLPFDLTTIKTMNTSGSWSGNVYTAYGVSFTVNDDGTVTASGTATGTAQLLYCKFIPVSGVSYVVNGSNGGSNSTYRIAFVYRDANNGYIGEDSEQDGDRAMSIPSGAHHVDIYVRVQNGYAASNLVFKPMIRRATEANATYVPFIGSQYTATFGQTVYGGTFDWVSGKLVVDMAMVDLGTLNWAIAGGVNGRFTADLASAAKPTGSYNIAADCICDRYVSITLNQLYASYIGIAPQSLVGTTVFVYDSAYSSAADFKAAMNGAQLCYELATPIEIDLDTTEVQTLQGLNNIWSDGEMSVDYAADLKTYIDNKIAAAVAALS